MSRLIMKSDFNDFGNKQVANLPNHLKQYIVDQHYDRYTPVDHAVWRYVMRQNYSYLKDVAYYPYIPGLRKAGLSIEKIPNLQEMNDNLGQIGWGAVTVDGFIPPVAFMEYQACKVLVIAADIRQLEHIEYSPAPDIIHESAGHAPIIADADYARYLSYIGEIGAKAMFSYKDFELYEAIRVLSILKEMPNADPKKLAEAEKDLDFKQKNLGEPSEMALLSRLHWWTVEYGLIGTLENPKIYGAGLLSSIGESASCMRPEVKKLWYTIDALNYSYDITQPQPQLFVTPTFENLIDVLEQYANTMSFRTGGTNGILKAMDCRNVCTAVYSSGLQVTGVLEDVILDKNNEPIYLKSKGASALSAGNKQLEGHGKEYHQDGFSSPIGRLRDTNKDLALFSEAELKNIGLVKNKVAHLIFESGITVEGFVQDFLFKENKLLLITFTDCTVKDGSKTLFEPSWGTFDMAVGEKIISVFCGAADKDAYDQIALVSNTNTHQVHYDEKTLNLHSLYQKVRNNRENNVNAIELVNTWKEIRKNFPNDWLLSMEILEILYKSDIEHETAEEIKMYLENKANSEPGYRKLILDGLNVLENPSVLMVNS